VEETNIPAPQFNKIVGHDPIFDIRGFSVLDDTKSARFLAHYSRFSETQPVPDTQEKYARLIRKSNIVAGEPTGATGLRKFRKEQQALRNLLIENREYATCASCGKSYPANFLVAAHVK
jgi:hypothetical protein